MSDMNSIRREMDARPQPSSGYERKRAGNKRKRTSVESRQPTAEVWISEVAQRWVDAAEAAGFRLPYNANYFALRLHDRVRGDKFLNRLEADGRHNDVVRLLDKMSDMFWKHYTQDGDTARTVADIYLDEVWEDCREFSYNSLRAIYLKKHGKGVKSIADSEPVDHRQAEYHREMRRLREKRWLEESLAQAGETPSERHHLTDHHRQVLKSAREKRLRREED